MPEYRRAKLFGGTYFFTVVTYQRRPILTTELARDILHLAWKDTQDRFPFTTDAICLLPDHIHCIWTLPEEDSNFSVRWKEIKRIFTKNFIEQFGKQETQNIHVSRQEAAIWQRRFWEHAIRDERDLNAHLNYIHYNPVKHGLVKRVADWPWSSFHRYVQSGNYDMDWGQDLEIPENFVSGE